MVSNKQAFEVSLADVSQTQLQGKTDVYLEFHVDDTTGANEVLCSFLINLHKIFLLNLSKYNILIDK
jgi:structure-specific recognition protein 1